MPDFTRHELQANCEACLIADAMKYCPLCSFYIQYPRATPEDISRMWERLWGVNARPASSWVMVEDGELLDLTQIQQEPK